jgi:hypothetical protein
MIEEVERRPKEPSNSSVGSLHRMKSNNNNNHKSVDELAESFSSGNLNYSSKAGICLSRQNRPRKRLGQQFLHQSDAVDMLDTLHVIKSH